jgi:hypothetical protein
MTEAAKGEYDGREIQENAGVMGIEPYTKRNPLIENDPAPNGPQRLEHRCLMRRTVVFESLSVAHWFSPQQPGRQATIPRVLAISFITTSRN